MHRTISSCIHVPPAIPIRTLQSKFRVGCSEEGKVFLVRGVLQVRVAISETGETHTVDLAPSSCLALDVAFVLIKKSREAHSAQTHLISSALVAVLETCRMDATFEEGAGNWPGGRSPPSGAKLMGQLLGPNAVLRSLVDEPTRGSPPGKDDALGGQEGDEYEVSWVPWLQLLRSVNGLAEGRCTECGTTWVWDHEDGARSVEFSDPLADPGLPLPGMELQAMTLCHAVEEWLIQNAPTFTSEVSTPSGGLSDRLAPDADPLSCGAALQVAEPGSYSEMLSHGVLWEVGEDPLPQQLGKTRWWPALEAQLPGATAMPPGDLVAFRMLRTAVRLNAAPSLFQVPLVNYETSLAGSGNPRCLGYPYYEKTCRPETLGYQFSAKR